MKCTSNLLKISALFAIIIIMVSCGEGKRPKNFYSVGDIDYEITHGKIINDGEIVNINNEDTTILFKINLRLECANGKDFINFGIISEEAERIKPGTYTNFEAYWVTGYDNGSYSNIGTITSGNLVIDRAKDGYIIDIDCIDQYSNNIEGEYKGNLEKLDNNNFVQKLPEYVLPSKIYNQVTAYIDIHSGLTPPDMTGEYVSSPHELIYESFEQQTDTIQYSDRYVGFIYSNQQKQMNFYGKQYDSSTGKDIEEIQYGVKITGEDDRFTCYYVVDGYPGGYYAQQSFIFSGKKTDEGLEDFRVAVVLLETSGNPDLQEKHSFRVLQDKDGLAENNYWLSKKASDRNSSLSDYDSFKMWMK